MTRHTKTSLLISIAAGGALVAAAGAGAASTPAVAPKVIVAAFPSPGSQYVAPGAQLALRGLPLGRLGRITVTGSRTGRHNGTLRSHSDGKGASFLPQRGFAPGERVTVRTSLSLYGTRGGTYTFTVAHPAGGFRYLPLPPSPRSRGDVQSFRSRPDLAPPSVSVLKRTSQASGNDIFLGNQNGPLQSGPMILGSDGRLIWFKRESAHNMGTDLRVQSYQGHPVLTWWEGYLSGGVGIGSDHIDDSHYRQIASVHAVGGVITDLHEFRITSRGTALVTSYYPVWWSPGRGRKAEQVLDCLAQEIDIKTGLLLFQWDSLDHVPLSDSYVPLSIQATKPNNDYFHINAIEPDRDGNLLISARDTWAVYKVDHNTGRVIWRLGGKHSSFKMGPGTSFGFQHDVRIHADRDGIITMFDNGAGPPPMHRQSQGLKLRLDTRRMTAQKVSTISHSPSTLAFYEGSYQDLGNGHSMLGWGQQPFFSEVDSAGRTVFEGRLSGINASYRAYRFAWNATPNTKPAVSASRSGTHTTVWASWNGATSVARWRVLGGSDRSHLRDLGTVTDRSFETAMSVPARDYVAVQALDAGGRVMGTSGPVRG